MAKGFSGGEVTLDLGTASSKQERFYKSTCLYTAYGGARGGGKTHAVRVKAVAGALTYPDIRILIVRRTYPELQSNHIEPMLRLAPKEIAQYSSTQRLLTFANGSTIRFGHFNGAAAECEYQGQEFDWIFMDEATQFTYREFRTLGACLRGVNDIPKRFYITCNPGGVGHAWVKRLFIDRDFRRGCANPEEDENPDDYLFIPATVEDNEALLRSSPAYLSMLSNLPKHLRAAHRYGDWNALGGAYFPELDADIHVCPRFEIPPTWRRFRSFDYGLDMFACLWLALSPDGRIYVYRELRESGLIVSEAVSRIHALTPPDEAIEATFAPPDMWSTQKDTGRTMAELFTLGGVPIIKAPNNRVQGHMQIKELLRPREGEGPALVLLDVCPALFGDMQAIQSDPFNPNDCARTPHEPTHSVDALRYFCASRTLPAQNADSGNEQDIYARYNAFMAGGSPAGDYIYY